MAVNERSCARNFLNLDMVSVGVLAWLLLGGAALGMCSVMSSSSGQVAHTEQGDFCIKAPNQMCAAQVAAECLTAGASVEWLTSSKIRIKFEVTLWGWWDEIRPQLTDCVVSARAEGRTAASGGK